MTSSGKKAQNRFSCLVYCKRILCLIAVSGAGFCPQNRQKCRRQFPDSCKSVLHCLFLDTQFCRISDMLKQTAPTLRQRAGRRNTIRRRFQQFFHDAKTIAFQHFHNSHPNPISYCCMRHKYCHVVHPTDTAALCGHINDFCFKNIVLFQLSTA